MNSSMFRIPIDVVSILLAAFVLLVAITRESARTPANSYWVPFETNPAVPQPTHWQFLNTPPTLSRALSVASSATI